MVKDQDPVLTHIFSVNLFTKILKKYYLNRNQLSQQVHYSIEVSYMNRMVIIENAQLFSLVYAYIYKSVPYIEINQLC